MRRFAKQLVESEAEAVASGLGPDRSEAGKLVFDDDADDLCVSLDRATKLELHKQDDVGSAPEAVARLVTSTTVSGDATPENNVAVTEMGLFVWGHQLHEDERNPKRVDVFFDGDETATARVEQTRKEPGGWSEAEKRRTGGGELPREKEKIPSSRPQQQIPLLPYDAILECVARVPILYHPTLSVVSKGFRSLMVSPELHATRSLLGCTEQCLYTFNTPLNQWFALCRKPKSGGNVLVPVPSSGSSPPVFINSKAIAAVGSDIYIIGGPMNFLPSSNVWVFDCRFRTWRQAPSMRVAREFAGACVLNGKIHVMGGCEASSTHWAEVFDPERQTWEPLPDTSCGPKGTIYGISPHRPAVLDGKVYVKTSKKAMVYEPEQGRWGAVDRRFRSEWFGPTCVVDNVMFGCNDNKLKWYDSKVRVWRRLKVEGMPNLGESRPLQIIGYGGKLAIFWEWEMDRSNVVGCAEIVLELRDLGQS